MPALVLVLMTVLATSWDGPPALAQPAFANPCAGTTIDGMFRLPDDAKGRRYLIRLKDAARPIAGAGTVRLDARDAHVVVPFDGMATIVRTRFNDDPVAAAIASVHATGGEVACPLNAIDMRPADGTDAMIVPHTPTHDIAPVPDAPMTCERPFVEASADHSVATEAPVMARQQGISGVVVVSVAVGERGNALDARIVSSPAPILNQSALTAARAMTYQPAVYRCAPSPQGRALFYIHFFTPRR
jgi:TonB family protein